MIIVLLFLSYIFALLQATFFSQLTFFSLSIDIILITFLILLFFGYRRQSLFFLIVSIIFLSLFSAVPFLLISLAYLFVFFLFIMLEHRKIISSPTVITSIIYFFLSTIAVNLFQIIFSADFTLDFFYLLLISALLNSIAGFLVYYLVDKVAVFYNPYVKDKKIKIVASKNKIDF